jgi:hypothetical protein
MTPTPQQTELDELSEYSEERIRGELPDEASERQTRTLVAAIRNPDVEIREIADAYEIENPSNITSTLKSLACGSLYRTQDAVVEASASTTEKRGHSRPAESFDELSERQQAVIDFLARHPFADWDDASSRDIYEAMQAYERGHASDMPDMSVSYPRQVAKKYAPLIVARRRELDDDEIENGGFGEYEGVDDTLDFTIDDTPRDILEREGFTLPDENLDVDESSDEDASEQLSDDERLAAAFENEDDGTYYANVEVGTYEFVDDSTGERSEIPGVRVNNTLVTRRSSFDDYVGDDELDDEDVDVGDVYMGEVNGKNEWGVWFTVGGDPSKPSDVSGVAAKELLAKVGQTLGDYERGDRALLAVTGRVTGRDGRIRHRFVPVPSEDTSEIRPETPQNVENGAEGIDDHEDVDDEKDAQARSEAYEDYDYPFLPITSEEQLNEVLATLAQGQDALGTKIGELEDINADVRISSLAQDISELDERIENLDGRLDTEYDDLVDYVESLRERVDEVEDLVDETVSEFSERHLRVDELEQALRIVREHGGSVTFDASVEIEDENENDEQEDT